MVNVRRHHPVLLNRLKQHFEAGDARALNTTLNELSAADFRTAGFLLADNLLSAYPKHFWNFFLTIVPCKPKAYLGTFLKAALQLYEKDEQTLNFILLRHFADEYATPIDARKCLEFLIPGMHSITHVKTLLEIFPPASPSSQAIILLKAATPISYFLLLQTLFSMDENKEEFRNYCIYLMKQGDSISFNMAVIIRTCFDLDSLPGTFSLKLEPYELSRLCKSYEAFEKVLLGI